MNLICGPETFNLQGLADDTLRVILYGQPTDQGDASAGAAAREVIRRAKLHPSSRAWDLLSLALSVVTADLAGLRSKSSDGWTRQFHLDIAVTEPTFWNTQTISIEKTLNFLTTDQWSIHFHHGGTLPKKPKKIFRPSETSVALISGGLDSLIGALDLASSGVKPLAVSQIVRGDKEKQVEFCKSIGVRHLQLTHAAGSPGDEEPSQRARSFIFLALGVLAATTLKCYGECATVPFFVCENGFIAINPPLTGGRIGSLSTRTAHPEFLTRFQKILDAADLKVRIQNPYAFVTKGEMMKACKNQAYLLRFAVPATSCGRFLHYNYTHCGRCVPCQVRRASFLESGIEDSTEYVFRDLGKDDEDHAGFDDVRSVAMAVAQAKDVGLKRWLGAALSYPNMRKIIEVEALVGRGLLELEALQLAHGVK